MHCSPVPPTQESIAGALGGSQEDSGGEEELAMWEGSISGRRIDLLLSDIKS